MDLGGDNRRKKVYKYILKENGRYERKRGDQVIKEDDKRKKR